MVSTYAENLAAAEAAVAGAQEAYDQQQITMPSDVAALNSKWAAITAAKSALAAVNARIAAAQLAVLSEQDTEADGHAA